MKSHKEDNILNNTLLDEKSKKILEEIRQEISSMSKEICNLYIKEMRCDITEEMANIWVEKLAYQSKYVNLLTEKLNYLSDKKSHI